MIYVGEVYSIQGRVAGPIYGSKSEVIYTINALAEYIRKDFDDTATELRCTNYLNYVFKRIKSLGRRLFSIKEWRLYFQEKKARKLLRKRRREQFRIGK